MGIGPAIGMTWVGGMLYVMLLFQFGEYQWAADFLMTDVVAYAWLALWFFFGLAATGSNSDSEEEQEVKVKVEQD